MLPRAKFLVCFLSVAMKHCGEQHSRTFQGSAFLLQERKKMVKEAQREKRKNKTPKHVKKRKEKTAKTRRGR